MYSLVPFIYIYTFKERQGIEILVNVGKQTCSEHSPDTDNVPGTLILKIYSQWVYGSETYITIKLSNRRASRRQCE